MLLAAWVVTTAQAQTSVTLAETPIDAQKASITTQEARQLAEEAYIFAYSMLENYKTMYAQAVNENPIKRYSIGDRTPGFTTNEDGSVTIYVQHKSPGPYQESNWLPAPDGPFVLALRIYWPEQDILDGKWQPSAIELVK